MMVPQCDYNHNCSHETARNASLGFGKQLYERIAKLAKHCSEVGNRLNKAVDAYNSSVATLEARVLVSARRFRELEAAPEGIEIEVAAPIDHTTRVLQAPELSQMPADESKR